MSDFPEFDQIVAKAKGAGAVLIVEKSPTFCSAIMNAGEFKGYNLVASVRIDGADPELCDPNDKMMKRLGISSE